MEASVTLKPSRAVLPLALGLLMAVLISPRAQAQAAYTFTVGALGGIGGSVDADPGDDLSNTSYGLMAGLLTDTKTHLMVRAGHLALDKNDLFESLTDAGLDYLTIAGEYRYDHNFYESGVYLGLGGYRLDGNPITGGGSSAETSFGVVLGLTGEFEITRRLGFAIDLAGHWANFDDAQIFVTGQAGIVVHF
jgi:hypothetical protein